MKIAFHPDWPEYDDTKPHYDQDGGPTAELASGFNDYPTFRLAVPAGGDVEPFSIHDIDVVTDYYAASYGDAPWPKGSLSSELDMVIVGRLKDGRYFSGALWNDYTGWGCQSGCDFRVADTLEDIHRFGLDSSEREKLGITQPASDPKET